MTSSSSRAPRASGLARPLTIATISLLLVTALPTAAHAHGLGDVTGRSVLDFVPLGIEHMLLGWDHLLFIAGVLLIASGWKQAAKLITVFVVGHSLTLIIATVAGWTISATLVDVIIGLSVVYVGFLALRGATPNWRTFLGVIFAFGLIHGLGLATRLQALGLPEEGLLARVIAFNVGIEIGQVIAILLITGLVAAGRWVWASRNQHQPRPVQMASAGLVLGGVVAATLVVYGAVFGSEEEAAAVVSQAPESTTPVAGCVQGPRTEAFPDGGGHTEKPFYAPTETTPMDDFGHSLADGYVAYLYRPDLSPEQVAALQEAVAADPNGGVLAGPVPDQAEAVKAVTATTTLACPEFDQGALAAFTSTWFAGLG